MYILMTFLAKPSYIEPMLFLVSVVMMAVQATYHTATFTGSRLDYAPRPNRDIDRVSRFDPFRIVLPSPFTYLTDNEFVFRGYFSRMFRTPLALICTVLFGILSAIFTAIFSCFFTVLSLPFALIFGIGVRFTRHRCPPMTAVLGGCTLASAPLF